MPDYEEPQAPTRDAIIDPEAVRSEALPPPVAAPVVIVEPTASETNTPADQTEAPEHRSLSKVKATALLAGAAAVANKVRHEAPKKVQELREKRAAGRHVILAEFEGRTIAIGPYRSDELARADVGRVGGLPTVIELRSPTTHFGPVDAPRPSEDRSQA